ncbi:MAG: circadian clock KaiB family protein [Phycisphaerales bacterium]
MTIFGRHADRLFDPAGTPGGHFRMTLYITGTSARSNRAIRNLREICDRYLPGRCDVQVVDIYQQPGLAREGNVVAAPTLVKHLPLPIRRFVGDLSDRPRVLKRLGVRPVDPSENDLPSPDEGE